MRIIVIGAAGMAGSRVIDEAAHRGHDVTAVFRESAPVHLPDGVVAVQGDATDPDHMTMLFRSADVVVQATRPRPGREDTVPTTTTALLDAAAASGVRLLVVGGAGPLSTPGHPGLLVLDDPDYVPAQWRAVAAASVVQLEVCRAHTAEWVYLSPAALFEPGRRSGTYRRGGTVLVTRPDGSSWISAEDFAVGVLDEIENPGVDRHVALGS